MTATTNPQVVVDDFNAAHHTGTWVRYWTGTRQDFPKCGQTRSKADLLSGHTPVVWVTGHGACIALTHVDVIPGQPDGIDDDSHNLPDPAGAAERVGEYIRANGDGIYDVLDGHPLYARDLEALRRVFDALRTERDDLANLLDQTSQARDRFRQERDDALAAADQLRQDLREADDNNGFLQQHIADVRNGAF